MLKLNELNDKDRGQGGTRSINTPINLFPVRMTSLPQTVTDNAKVQSNPCTSPLLFSDPPSFNTTTTTTHATFNRDSPALIHSNPGSGPSHHMQDLHGTDLHAGSVQAYTLYKYA